MRLAAPTTWTRWFLAAFALFVAYNVVAAYRAYGYYFFIIDWCEPDRRFQGAGPGISCVGWSGFSLMVGFLWLIGAVVFGTPMIAAYMHAPKRRDIAKPS